MPLLNSRIIRRIREGHRERRLGWHFKQLSRICLEVEEPELATLVSLLWRLRISGHHLAALQTVLAESQGRGTTS